MNLPGFAVHRPITVAMIFVGVLLVGSLAYLSLPIDLMPEVETPAISVITVYPGASAEDVETEVTREIEDRLSTVNSLDEISSTSKENLSLVTALFEWGTDLDQAANDIRDLLEAAKRELPDDAEQPTLFKFSSSMMPTLVLGISADETYPGLHHVTVNRHPGLLLLVQKRSGADSVEVIRAAKAELAEIRRRLPPDVEIAQVMDASEFVDLSVSALAESLIYGGLFVGVVVFFFLTGTTLSMISFIGAIIVVVIVVKNGIVLVDYANILRARGLGLFEAVTTAGSHRLRPVLMTALTTILGMVPMAVSRGEGAEIWRPLGITVIGGLLVSTGVTLVLVPVIYSIFESHVRRAVRA